MLPLYKSSLSFLRCGAMQVWQELAVSFAQAGGEADAKFCADEAVKASYVYSVSVLIPISYLLS